MRAIFFSILAISLSSSLMRADYGEDFFQALHDLFFPRNDSLSVSSSYHQNPAQSSHQSGSHNQHNSTTAQQSDPGDLEEVDTMKQYVRDICRSLYGKCSSFVETTNADSIIQAMKYYIHDAGGVKFISKNRVDELINSQIVQFFEDYTNRACVSSYHDASNCSRVASLVRDAMVKFIQSKSTIDPQVLMNVGLKIFKDELANFGQAVHQNNYAPSSNNPPAYNPEWLAEQERLNNQGQPQKKCYPTDECPVCMESFGGQDVKGVKRLFIACGHNLCPDCKAGCNHVCPLCRARY